MTLRNQKSNGCYFYLTLEVLNSDLKCRTQKIKSYSKNFVLPKSSFWRNWSSFLATMHYCKNNKVQYENNITHLWQWRIVVALVSELMSLEMGKLFLFFCEDRKQFLI